MTKSLGQFQRELRSFATTGMTQATRAALRTSSQLGVVRLEQRYARAGLGSMRMKGYKGKRVQMRIRYDVKHRKNLGGSAVLFPSPPGPAYLFEYGAYKKPQGYDITPAKYGKRAKRNAAARGETLRERSALATPYGFKAKVHHPGVKGRRIWRGTAKDIAPEVARTFAVEIGAQLARAFR